jgi:hypothetical protein
MYIHISIYTHIYIFFYMYMDIYDADRHFLGMDKDVMIINKHSYKSVIFFIRIDMYMYVLDHRM